MSKYGSFNLKGIKELEKAINEKVKGSKRIIREAVNGGAEVMADTLKTNYQKVKDKGYSQGYTADEIVRSNASSYKGIIEAKVGWNGPHDRWRLVHLEEFGYNIHGKMCKPPQFGIIDKSIREGQPEYFAKVARKLSEHL